MSIYRPLPDPVCLKCPRCGRAGRYRRDRYRQITGGADPHTALEVFARSVGCELAHRPDPEWDQRCGIVYDFETQKEPPPARAEGWDDE